MTVDTLSLAKELRAAELSSAQAEAIAAAIGRGAAEGLNSAATKADIGQLEVKIEQLQSTSATKADIAQIETKIEQLRSSLLMWFVGTILTMAAIVIAVVKL